jgi:hypothetical protein
MSRLSNEHSNSYWPGYVDALVNVVLNLLFLAAILAVGSFTQGLENSRKVLKEMSGVDDTARKTTGDTAPRSPAESRSQMRDQAPSREELKLILHFADYTVRLDDSARERLKRELQRQISQGVQYWQVSIDADVEDNTQRRAAYLRMISLRSVFLEVGIDPSRFSLLMQSAPVENVGQQRVHIVSKWQVPERKSSEKPHKGDTESPLPEPVGQERQG